MFVKIFYLLYKIINQDDLWIIKMDNDINYLLSHIKQFKSDDEIYLIIERTINLRLIEKYISNINYYYMDPINLITEDIEYLLDFKRFQKFILRADDNIIKGTKHITFYTDILKKNTNTSTNNDTNNKKVKKTKYFLRSTY